MTAESQTMHQAADRKQPLALSRGMFDTLAAFFEGAGVLLAGWLAAAALQAVGETAPIPAHAPLFIVALAVAYLI
ncbi:MAG: hypothetical protein JNJ97_13260, partial [Alphaproteobacteria bacterium]|nr:hypothetical protein [Alphaproteobacteria bacterium]